MLQVLIRFFFLLWPFVLQIVFTDARNKAIFTNSDFGRSIQKHMVDFTPSDVSFYEHDKRTFLVLDKEDPERKVGNWVCSVCAPDFSYRSTIFHNSCTTRSISVIHLTCYKATSNRSLGRVRAMEASRCICTWNARNRRVSCIRPRREAPGNCLWRSFSMIFFYPSQIHQPLYSWMRRPSRKMNRKNSICWSRTYKIST